MLGIMPSHAGVCPQFPVGYIAEVVINPSVMLLFTPAFGEISWVPEGKSELADKVVGCQVNGYGRIYAPTF